MLTEPRNFRRILLLLVIGRQQCDTRDTRHISYIRRRRQLMVPNTCALGLLEGRHATAPRFCLETPALCEKRFCNISLLCFEPRSQFCRQPSAALLRF